VWYHYCVTSIRMPRYASRKLLLNLKNEYEVAVQDVPCNAVPGYFITPGASES
jgi:hypothetical protein